MLPAMLAGMKRRAALTMVALLPAIPGTAAAAPRQSWTNAEETICRELTLTARPWATVRWEVSLTEARRRAEREGKPIFLVVNTGNVLGFV